MFINIDHEKRPSDYKLHLAKPNKEIISVLHEKQNSALNLKLGNISELNFSIPYFVEDSNLQMIKNPNIERIRELMYVKLTWGEFEEWFLIDNITESSEDNEIMNIQAFSIGYENKRKKINEFKETAINATEFYTEILKDSPWSIGEIDGSFDLLYRSFDESGTDRFELIKTGAETFGGVIVWDTNNKKINLKEPDNIGEFRGLTVSYDRLMSSLNKTRTTDEMVTRLYVYGNERITIENKNPTNEKYIEDYSYFMHPFKRDANKNVLESSYYMSDSLCHALLDNKELRDEYEPQIKTIQKNIENKNASLSLAMIELSDAEFTLMSAKGLLDIAKAVDDKALIEQRKTEVSNATSIVNTKKTAVNNLTSQIEGLQNQVSVLQNAISVRSFTKELIDELEPYIIEKEIEDARYIDEDELYKFAKEKFSEIREPRVVIETGIEGLMNSVEEQYYWDKLVLGDTMRVRQKRMDIDYKSRIIEMNVGLDDSDVEVKIANFTENVDNLDKFISILYSSESNSTILNNNKYKWDSVVDIRDEVTQLRESEIDATTKRITAGVNESVEIGERGVVITTPSFPNEMIIMQAGVIALSEDGGENWKTSITPRGVIADTIIGKLVASNNLIVTNDSGSMVLDGTGLTIDADSIKIMSGGSNPKNIIEDWNNMIIDMDNFADDNVLTPYEKSQILHQWNMISDAHTKLIESFIDNMGNETVENPYPLEYDIYLETYERLKNFLFSDKQSDGYSVLDSSRMQFVSPVSSESYRSTLTNYMTSKDDFILVIPMEYTNASIRVLEEGIFLEYVKSDELVASLNLSEEGVRIDGKLLSINSETRFRDDVVMDAGVIKSADNAIRIDLNAGTIDLSRPLTINAVPVATKEDIENIEMTYTPILSNDTANIPTDENGNNGNYYTANTEITIYQQSKDDTINWTITADKSAGITGSLSGNKYTVTNMTTNVGYVDLIAKKSGKTLVKRFTLAKAKDGQSGRIPPMLSLSSTGQIMTFDSGNNPTPSSQEIQVVAKVNNYEGQVSWKIEKFNGSSLVETTAPSKNPQNTIMINQSVMTGDITSVRVTAYDLAENSNFSDYITIYKLKESMDGVGIESITEYYLATSQETGVTSSTSGFTTTIQTMSDINRYLWNYEKIKYTDGTDKNTVPVIIGVHGQKGDIGEDGRSIASITEHYLATSLESGVSRGTSGWTTVMQQTDETKRYLWNYETIGWNKAPLTTYVEPVIIGVHGKKGEDGKNSITGLLTNEAMTLPATTSGTVTDFSSANGVFEVFDGTTKVNGTAVYSVVYQSNITVSINQSGAYSVSVMAVGASVTQGTATLRAVYNGVTLEKTLNVSKALVGESGSSATSYWVTASANVVKKDIQNNIVPTSVTFSGFQKVGTNNPTAYSGRFIISTSVNGKDYTNVYTSSSNQTTYEYVVPKDVNFIKARFYQSGGTSILLDEQTVPVLVDAEGIDKKYEGQSLLDKTEILSGTEIYTDKADDSVVHMDVDGKSYQNAKSDSKNLAPHLEHWNLVSGATYNSKDNTITIPVGGQITAWIPWDGTTNSVKTGFDVHSGSNMHQSLSYYAEDKKTLVKDVSGAGTGNGYTGSITPNTRGNAVGYYTIDNNVKYVLIAITGSSNYVSEPYTISNISIRSDNYVYEPPAPTPEYPIAIHSLNDFDVMSSKATRNLYPNSGNFTSLSGWSATSSITNKDGFSVLQTVGGGYPVTIGQLQILEPNTEYIVTAEFMFDTAFTITAGTPVHIYVKTATGGAMDALTGLSLVGGNRTVRPNVWETVSVTFKTLDIFEPIFFKFHLYTGSTHMTKWLKTLSVRKGKNELPWTPAPEDISESENYPLIDKTNILLSEPLRSVGDVKDGLFRDNDGLWKIERNVGEKIFTGGESFTTVQPTDNTMIRFTYTPLASETRSGYNNVLSNYFKPNKEEAFGAVTEESIDTHPSSGNMEFFIKKARLSTHDSAGFKSWLTNKHIAVQYVLAKPAVEILPQEFQDKLNNIASYKDSNYLYTIVDKTNILPSYVRDNLNPTLHATFKGGGWYSRFKTEQGFNQTNKSVDNLKNETIPALKDGLLNSSEKEAVRQSLNVVSADKKGIDTQYITVYANTALTGTAKTNLKSSKDALNTAFTNLQSAINAVLGVGDGTRITDTQMTLVTTRLNEYGTALSAYSQRYEQAQDAISTEKKRLGDVYAKAQADLAETQAKAHADGKITAEEQRAIADAQAKLDEAKKYVDDLEIGSTNLLRRNDEVKDTYILDGAVYPKPSKGTGTVNYSTSIHLIPVKAGEDIFLTKNIHADSPLTGLIYWRIGWLNSSKTWVSRTAVSEDSKRLTVPSGVSYLWASYPTDADVKIERGSKSTGFQLAYEDIIDNKNILSQTNGVVENGAYNITRYNLTEAPKDGAIVTFTLWGELASTKTNWSIYNSGGNVRLSTLTDLGNGVYQVTFPWTSYSTSGRTADNSYVNVYAFTDAQSGTSRIDKVKLEYGKVGTKYSPAPEDVQSEIDNKVDLTVIDSLTGSISNLDDAIANLGVDTLAQQLSDYQETLSSVESDAKTANDTLEEIGNSIVAINNNLNGQSEKWNSLEGFVQIDTATNTFSIQSFGAGDQGSAEMVLSSGSLNFYSNKSLVASITNQYMKIDRGIFVESMHIGRHQWEPLSSDRDHFVLSYVGEPPS